MRDKCEWNELVLIHGKHEWNTETFRAGMVVRYRDKPEPEVIIRKSGGTWVARYDGVDYLRIVNTEWSLEEIFEDFKTWRDHWKPISEIEITDEIAKLRPMVLWTYNSRVPNLCTLYAVNGMEFPCVCYNHESDEYDGYIKDECRLATVFDLEES